MMKKDTITSIKLIDAYPDKGFYTANKEVNILIEIESEENINKNISIIIYKNYDVEHMQTSKISLIEGCCTYKVKLDMKTTELAGYGVQVKADDNVISTAFDVTNSWASRPRYAFLSDFYEDDEIDSADVESLLKHHINVVQFYDWMYKHEDLIPKTDYYVDLLERRLSKKAVLHKIELCRERGIYPQAYGAIYAASKDYYEKNKELALYTNDDKPQNLGNWFYIMNISQESPWREHIINEFKKAIQVMGFQGIHMDTYGFPKLAFSKLYGITKLEKLNEQFPSLINETKQMLDDTLNDSALTFNAVSNWAIEDVAKSNQDVLYIEVWSPQDTYYHLNQLVARARELSGKQVILAAYLKCFEENNKYTQEQCHVSLLLASTTIFASGGFHFIIGEENGILPDPYYVKYVNANNEQVKEIRSYYDFIVRYGDLLFDTSGKDESMTYANGINSECIFQNGKFSSYPKADAVWTLVRMFDKYKTINLINYTGIKSDIWDEGKERYPDELRDIQVQVLVDEKVKACCLASPDYNQCMSEELEYELCETDRGQAINFTIPRLKIWDLVYIEIEE